MEILFTELWNGDFEALTKIQNTQNMTGVSWNNVCVKTMVILANITSQTDFKFETQSVTDIFKTVSDDEEALKLLG